MREELSQRLGLSEARVQVRSRPCAPATGSCRGPRALGRELSRGRTTRCPWGTGSPSSAGLSGLRRFRFPFLVPLSCAVTSVRLQTLHSPLERRG